MRRIVPAAFVLPLLGACEVFEPYSIEYREIFSQNGVSVYSNLMEDVAGDRWVQFAASNGGSFPFCVQVSFVGENNTTSGHSMGGIYRINPGATMDIGYVTMPGRFDTTTKRWIPQDNGDCGDPPPG